MNNEFWIIRKRKNSYLLEIDIYDPAYMEVSREQRFSELKTLLANDIMEVTQVHIDWDYTGLFTGLLFDLKKDWTAIERIVKIHQSLEYAYTWLTPFYEKYEKRPDLVLDESYDQNHLPHYQYIKHGKK